MKDSNVLIAEFMGLVVSNREDYHSSLHTNVDADLKYHTSWDWLMPVVEKIECINTVDEDTFHTVVVEGLECSIGHVCNVGQTKMEAVYKSVLEFIKQQNKNK